MGVDDSNDFPFFLGIRIVPAREDELFVTTCHIAARKVFFPAANDTKQAARFFRKFFLRMRAYGVYRLWRHISS